MERPSPSIFDLLESKHKDHVFFLSKWGMLLNKRRLTSLLNQNIISPNKKTYLKFTYGIKKSLNSIILSCVYVLLNRKINNK